MVWCFPQFLVMHKVKGFGVVSKVDVFFFFELSYLFYDPMDVSNLTSGSSVFFKSIFNIGKLSFHVLLKPHSENVEQYFASLLAECSCVVDCTFYCIAFLWDWNEN